MMELNATIKVSMKDGTDVEVKASHVFNLYETAFYIIQQQGEYGIVEILTGCLVQGPSKDPHELVGQAYHMLSLDYDQYSFTEVMRTHAE